MQPGAARAGADTAKACQAARKILYYRNPMGLPDTSPVPKKDPMGMDYIAGLRRRGAGTDGPAVKISVDKVQKLGVRTEAAAPRELVRTVRAVATVQVDERAAAHGRAEVRGLDRAPATSTPPARRCGAASR